MLNVKNVLDFAIPVNLILIFALHVLIQNIEQEASVIVLMDGIAMEFQIIVYHAVLIVKLVLDQKNVICAHQIQIEN